MSEFQQLMRDATKRGDTNELKLLMKQGEKIDPDELLLLLKLATRRFDEEAALVLLDAGHLRLDEEVKCGLAGIGTRTFQFLLDHEIFLPDLDLNVWGWCLFDPPFHYVAWNKTKDPDEIVKMLVKHGVSMGTIGWAGNSCYDEAVRHENYVALHRLIEYGPMILPPKDVECVLTSSFMCDNEFREKAALLLLSTSEFENYNLDPHRLTLFLDPCQGRITWIDLIVSGCVDWTNYTQLEILNSEVTEVEIDRSKRRLKMARIGLIRRRALEICTALQSLCIDALQMCEILIYSCGHIASLIPFHIWWNIATTVKHFRK